MRVHFSTPVKVATKKRPQRPTATAVNCFWDTGSQTRCAECDLPSNGTSELFREVNEVEDDGDFAPKPSTTLTPSRDDVTFGRGEAINSETGNVQSRSVVTKHRYKYYTCFSRRRKKIIVGEIVQTIRDRGGRFKQNTSGYWEPVDDELAVATTQQAMRDIIAGVFTTRHVATLHYGSMLRVTCKAINSVGLSRLRIISYLSYCLVDGFRKRSQSHEFHFQFLRLQRRLLPIPPQQSSISAKCKPPCITGRSNVAET
jgi:hypothetical protein